MEAIERLDKEQAVELYTDREVSLTEMGLRAQALADGLHPEPVRTYVIERNINYTNICRTRCSFCAFSVSTVSSEGAFVLDGDQLRAKIDPLVRLGGTQILLQGGMNPELPLAWYEHMLREIKSQFPELHIHAFSPPEIVFMSRHFEVPISRLLHTLHEAGLDTIPGGGAEILVDRVRRQIAPAKCTTDEWLEVMRQAHKLGMHTTATMMYGHLETPAERIEHLDRLRQLQDEAMNRKEKHPESGCFTAFTCWPFQPGQTRLAEMIRSKHNGPAKASFFPAGAVSYLRLTALARVYLDNIANIQASWVTQGPEIGQLSLLMGCNDIGSLMMEENVVSAAGTTFVMQLAQLRQLIRSAGFEPVQRDYYYRHIPASN